MSVSRIIGICAIVLVIISAFLPWVSIHVDGRHLVFSGMHTEGSRFGEPGKLCIIVALMVLPVFLIRKKWAPRVGLFTSAFLAAWAFRNMLLYSRCEMGICPEQQIGLYLSLAASLVAFICVLMQRPLGSR